MAYTASALSFMLEGLSKPVILTGSQLPVGVPRSDGVRISLVPSKLRHMRPMDRQRSQKYASIQYSLYRGNRAHKFNSENFEAFLSVNYPPLAEAGVSIRFNFEAIDRSNVKSDLTVHEGIDNSVATIGVSQHESRSEPQSREL